PPPLAPPAFPTRRSSDLLIDRSEEPRPGNLSARDGVAQRHVDGLADALHGGETRHQHRIGVRGGRQRRVGRRFAGVGGTTVLAEDRKSTRLNSSHVKISY